VQVRICGSPREAIPWGHPARNSVPGTQGRVVRGRGGRQVRDHGQDGQGWGAGEAEHDAKEGTAETETPRCSPPGDGQHPGCHATDFGSMSVTTAHAQNSRAPEGGSMAPTPCPCRGLRLRRGIRRWRTARILSFMLASAVGGRYDPLCWAAMPISKPGRATATLIRRNLP